MKMGPVNDLFRTMYFQQTRGADLMLGQIRKRGATLIHHRIKVSCLFDCIVLQHKLF